MGSYDPENDSRKTRAVKRQKWQQYTIVLFLFVVVIVAATFLFFRGQFSKGRNEAQLSSSESMLLSSSTNEDSKTNTNSSSKTKSESQETTTSETTSSTTQNTEVDLHNLTREQLSDWILRSLQYNDEYRNPETFNDGIHSELQFSINDEGLAEAAYYLPNPSGAYLTLQRIYIVDSMGQLIMRDMGGGRRVVATDWETLKRYDEVEAYNFY